MAHEGPWLTKDQGSCRKDLDGVTHDALLRWPAERLGQAAQSQSQPCRDSNRFNERLPASTTHLDQSFLNGCADAAVVAWCARGCGSVLPGRIERGGEHALRRIAEAAVLVAARKHMLPNRLLNIRPPDRLLSIWSPTGRLIYGPSTGCLTYGPQHAA